MALTVDEILERARRMLDVPTLYWIGTGGNVPSHDAISPPGDPLDLQAAVAALAPAKRMAYLAKAQAAGVDPQRLPPLKACDCSGFVWWVLCQPRHDRNTDWIWHDAQNARTEFEPVDERDPLRAQPGAVVVYPKPPAAFRNSHGEPEDYGHVGIVTAVDAGGHLARVIHCAAENFLAPPEVLPDGRQRERNAIAETGPEKFLEHVDLAGRATRVVWRTQVPR